MPSRSAALLIALVLFWSAFAAFGQARPPAPLPGVQIEMNWLADAGQQPGSDEPAPLDDSSTPSQAEGGVDSPELLLQLPDPRVPALTLAPPRPHPAAAWRAPTLDGLRRPPRGNPLTA